MFTFILVLCLAMLFFVAASVQSRVSRRTEDYVFTALKQAISEDSKCVVAGEPSKVVFGVPRDMHTYEPRPAMAAEIVRAIHIKRNGTIGFPAIDYPVEYSIERDYVIYIVLHEKTPGVVYLRAQAPGLLSIETAYLVVTPEYADAEACRRRDVIAVGPSAC